MGNDVNIDAEKLKFFTAKVKIWDDAKISLSECQRLSADDRSSILRIYYQDMSKNCSVNSGKIIITLFYFCHFFLFQQREKSKKSFFFFLELEAIGSSYFQWFFRIFSYQQILFH